MASYHLSVKTVQRSAGRSATAAIAYRAAERIACEREGRVHDYRAKQGVEASFIVAPEEAPAWATDRQALWNAAEARETRSNSVTAREWELALPHELDAGGRRALVEGFARELVARYGVAADVAIHAPHREGDQRNWHAHVLTTTRSFTAEGLGDKTRVLDAKQTGGPEIATLRERWAELQNQALERQGHAERVDHRSLAVQRDEARSLGQEARADNLDRAPEVKMGPVVSGLERREERAAEREGRAYVPVTERGAQVHEARAARSLLAELGAELGRLRDAVREEVRQRSEAARATYAQAREEGADRVRAGLAALRAAAERHGLGIQGHGERQERSREAGGDPWAERQARRDTIKERLARIIGRAEPTRHAQDGPQPEPAVSLQPHGLGEQDRAQPVAARKVLAAGMSAPGQDLDPTQDGQRARSSEVIRERLDALRDQARPGAPPGTEHERDDVAERLRAHREGMDRMREVRAQAERHLREQGILPQDTEDARERLEKALGRARPAAALGQEGYGSMVARVVERARDEPAWAASFRVPAEAQAFREEMERRFTPDTLARLGRGEAGAVAEVAEAAGDGSRLDGLCLARAWLDAHGEDERSPVRMRLTYGIIDARHEAKHEREAHKEKGHSWEL